MVEKTDAAWHDDRSIPEGGRKEMQVHHGACMDYEPARPELIGGPRGSRHTCHPHMPPVEGQGAVDYTGGGSWDSPDMMYPQSRAAKLLFLAGILATPMFGAEVANPVLE